VQISGCTALVTGASRGIGAAFVEGLISKGAGRVYAAMRKPIETDDPRVVPVELDVTDVSRVRALAEELDDVDLVVNNAGLLYMEGALTASLEHVREQFEVNYLGLLSVSQAFSPVLAANGGGAFVNVLSVGSWIGGPPFGPYAASKAAAWAISNALRIELWSQNTQVVGIHVGLVDTDMVAELDTSKRPSSDSGKLPPGDVVEAALQGLVNGDPEVLVDPYTKHIKSALSEDHAVIYPELHAAYHDSAS
jgi:NAD(P)-dependent dehydrogenase (short-subunit alcohol dehydrogenase family)